MVVMLCFIKTNWGEMEYFKKNYVLYIFVRNDALFVYICSELNPTLDKQKLSFILDLNGPFYINIYCLYKYIKLMNQSCDSHVGCHPILDMRISVPSDFVLRNAQTFPS